MYRTWISYNHRVIRNIDIYESVWRNQHIITNSHIAYNAGISPDPDPISDYRDSSLFACGIPADSYTVS